MKKVELIAIGNELLIGDVLDTNTNWLCKELTGLGAFVRHAAMVRDEEEAIAEELRASLRREADLIFTCGGLGPTDDDLTLRAVAYALARSLEEHPRALTMIRARYDELKAQGLVDVGGLTPARQKMALLPEGAEPVYNPVGTAPAVVLQEGKSTIVCLPGVPAELKGIFQESLQPLLKEHFGQAAYCEWILTVECRDESVLAPLLQQVVGRHPNVYIKSRARPFGPEVHLRITLSASGETMEAVQEMLGAAHADLRDVLEKEGIAILRVEEMS